MDCRKEWQGMTYETTINELVKRIVPVIKRHPQLMNTTDAWELFKYPEFDCRDLQPSLAQAFGAFEQAKQKATLQELEAE